MQDISLTKIISIIWFIALITWTLFSVDKGENTMDTGIIVALIGAGSLVGVDILANIRGWRKLSKQIGVDKNERSISTQIGAVDEMLPLAEQLGVKSRSISEQLGVKSRSISEQLGVKSRSISEQLGVDNNSENLTAQHQDIKDTIHNENRKINNDINTIKTIVKEEKVRKEEREKILNPSQLKMNETIQALSDFKDSWQGYIEKCSNLEKQIAMLESQTSELRNENISLNNKIYSQINEITNLKAINEKSNEQLKTLSLENQKQKEKINKLETALTEKQKQVDSLISENSELKASQHYEQDDEDEYEL